MKEPTSPGVDELLFNPRAVVAVLGFSPFLFLRQEASLELVEELLEQGVPERSSRVLRFVELIDPRDQLASLRCERRDPAVKGGGRMPVAGGSLTRRL
ncbi:MAG TPA: hypothetical protein VIA62_03675 [Thermoanaerobaculia bacterium]|nr:hypothetical protein [Thermoanaerobaculia bacterium]